MMCVRGSVVLCALLLLVALGYGCDDTGERYYGLTRPKHGPDELWYNLSAEPEWVDPNKAADNASGVVVRNLFSGLTQPHPVTLEPMPEVAEGWEISDAGRRYLFHLRESYWSDGTPVTAHDFVFSWRRVLDPTTASRYATFLYPLRYAEEAHRRALRLTDLPPGTSEAQVRAWAGEFELERVRMAPDVGGAFLHLRVPEGETRREYSKRAVAMLSGRPFEGKPVRLRIATGEDIAIRAPSDRLLEVELNDPLPYFLSIVAFYTAMPVPRHLLQSLADRKIHPALWTRPEYLVTNGAYTLETWKFRQYMVLRKNPRYWDADAVHVERVKLSMIESYTTALQLYKAGEIDHFGEAQVPAEFLDHLARFEDFHHYDYLATYFLWLNTERPPLDNPKVREALSLAIDREALVKYILRGGQKPTRDLVPDGVGGYQGLNLSLFDPHAAREKLREAGYGPDHPLPPFTYRYNTNEGHKQVAEAVQQMWKKHLGATVELENEEWKVYLKHLQQTDFEVARMGWIGDYADPYTFLEIMMSGSGNNHSNWHNPRFDGLLERANATLDRTRRLSILREAETLVMGATPVIPIYVYTRSEMVKPYVRGAFHNYLNTTYFKYMSIDERFYDGAPGAREDTPPVVRRPYPAPSPQALETLDAGVPDAATVDAATVDRASGEGDP